ncbi:MAG: hypothetical protein R6V57_07935 [Vicinamibacterales bacterium]
MKKTSLLTLVGVGLLLAGPFADPCAAQKQEPPKVQMPQPGVPEIMTMEGRYVRIAYNNEGFVTLGYKLANLSIGEPWMLLEVGFTVLDRTPNYDLMRDALSLTTPDGQTIPLPSLEEFRKGDLRALQNRERVQRDSINYFPTAASRPCSVQFFTNVDSRAMAWDKVQLSTTRACLGRLYFQVPGGITYGQHWLNVKFAQSVVRVPFRILTEEEDKLLDKNFKDIKKQMDDAFKKKD